MLSIFVNEKTKKTHLVLIKKGEEHLDQSDTVANRVVNNRQKHRLAVSHIVNDLCFFQNAKKKSIKNKRRSKRTELSHVDGFSFLHKTKHN